jgi:adenosylmethionine-8-amino-7-oxononanoate aminotransferase
VTLRTRDLTRPRVEFMPRRLLEAGLIARADDRGDTVLQIAPPLISTAAELDEIVDAMAGVLSDAGTLMGVPALGARSA